MLALAEPSLDHRIGWIHRTVDCARTPSDANAQGWQAAAQSNIGSDLRMAWRLDECLAASRDALAACVRDGRADLGR